MTSALLYTSEGFTELPGADPINELFMRDGCSVPELIARLDYVFFTSVRHQNSAPLGLTVYRRVKAPQWIVLLESPSGSDEIPDQYAYVFCEGLPQVMELLAEWTPTVHNMASAELAAFQLDHHLDG